MDIVKKNIVSVVLGVVALVCVVLVFFPLGGMYARMTEDVKKSKATGDALLTVSNEKRTWPTLSSKPEDSQPLKRFPTNAINAAGHTITETWTKETSDFVELAVKVQQDSLKELVPGLLPGVPGQQTLPIRFMESYRKLMNLSRPGALPAVPVVDGPPQPVLNTPLLGRNPPSDAEIAAKSAELANQIRGTMPIVIGGVVSNAEAVEKAVVTQTAELGDRMRAEVAKKSVVYLDPTTTFISSDKIVGTTAPLYNDIFVAQVGLWVQQEICRAIYDINHPRIEAGQQGVIDAPIKRLIGVRFAVPYLTPPPVAPGTPAPTDVPVLPGLPAARVAHDFVRNPLGQISNDLYDVVPFRITLVCEAETLPATLKGLGQNRFMSIRGVDVQAVDATLAFTQGFIYGNRPVVQASVRGQYLIMRKFIGPLMPPDIIRGLTTPAVPGAAPVDPGV